MTLSCHILQSQFTACWRRRFEMAPVEALMEASVMSRDVPSCGGRLPIFHCAPDLIAHMLIVSGWYLCLSQPLFFYRRLSVSCRFMPVAHVQPPVRGSNGCCVLLRLFTLYFQTKPTDAACVLQGDRMGPTGPLYSFQTLSPLLGDFYAILLNAMWSSSEAIKRSERMICSAKFLGHSNNTANDWSFLVTAIGNGLRLLRNYLFYHPF